MGNVFGLIWRFFQVGKSLCHSILDLTGQNPYSRLPNSEFHSLNGLRDWLRLNCMNEIGLNSAKTATNKVKVKKSSSLQSQVGESVNNFNNSSTENDEAYVCSDVSIKTCILS